MPKKLVLIVFLTMLAASLSGCNMISGLGRDISGAADTVEGWFTKP